MTVKGGIQVIYREAYCAKCHEPIEWYTFRRDTSGWWRKVYECQKCGHKGVLV